jgi:hypothetical protein
MVSIYFFGPFWGLARPTLTDVTDAATFPALPEPLFEEAADSSPVLSLLTLDALPLFAFPLLSSVPPPFAMSLRVARNRSKDAASTAACWTARCRAGARLAVGALDGTIQNSVESRFAVSDVMPFGADRGDEPLAVMD